MYYPWECNALLPDAEKFDPDSIFRKATIKMISELPPTYKLVRRKDITKDDPHPDNKIASVPLEHPNVDRRWGCQINIYVEYIGPEDPSHGHEMEITDWMRSDLNSAIVDDRKNRIKLNEAEYLNSELYMRLKIHKTLRFTKYLYTFEYLGPSKNPIISIWDHDGGDSVYYGASSCNPHPENFLTRRSEPENSVNIAQEGGSTEDLEAKADV